MSGSEWQARRTSDLQLVIVLGEPRWVGRVEQHVSELPGFQAREQKFQRPVSPGLISDVQVRTTRS